MQIEKYTRNNLNDYLETERLAEKESLEHWKPEFDLFCELAELYTQLVHALTISDSKMLLSADFLLIVEGQMFGVISQLLRRRLTDGKALTRRAIEATATAYRLWKQPELIEIFLKAYPNAAKTEDRKQWQLSRRYREEFSTRKLFDQQGVTWERLKRWYEIFSAFASHASPGAIVGHESRVTQRYAPFLATDDKEIRRVWYNLLAAYMGMWKVFLRIFRAKSKEPSVDTLEKSFVALREHASRVMHERAPWIDPVFQKE